MRKSGQIDMIRKFMAFVLILFLLTGRAAAEPVIEAESAVLINGRTGEVLWEKNPHKPMFPASTTKILTAVLLLENADPDELVVSSLAASAVRGASLYLLPGQEIRVDDLLYGLMLQSANDGAVAAAEHVAGSVQSFAAMMNSKAKQAGALNSHFTNPHGLPDEAHLTTAYDLAMITRYAMMNPYFRDIAAARRHSLPWPGDRDRIVVNRIPLMQEYDGMLGVKSGYTVEARHTFVGAAKRDGLELIAVVLRSGGKSVWSDTKALLDYGFTRFAAVRPLAGGDRFGPVDVRFGMPVSLQAVTDFEFTHTGPPPVISLQLVLASVPTAPVKRGDVLGEVQILADGRTIGQVAVVAADDVRRSLLASGWFWLFSGLFILTGLQVRKLHRRRRRKKRATEKRETNLAYRKFR
jgi:serine-type D-Ala-D-Ala carboxypeptidase (penicillin-binding protein 5/6)